MFEILPQRWIYSGSVPRCNVHSTQDKPWNKAPRSPVSVVLLWDMSYLLFGLAFSNRRLHALWVYNPVVRI
jgi:hypothetical protein